MYTKEQLEQLGERLGTLVQGGECIELVGDVGAGKTTLTKAIARGMGITEPITSPTFTISNRYQAPSGLSLVHYDFYRLADPGIIASELAEAADDDRAVVVVEWAGIVEDVLPTTRLVIRIEPVSEDQRSLRVSGADELRKRAGL